MRVLSKNTAPDYSDSCATCSLLSFSRGGGARCTSYAIPSMRVVGPEEMNRYFLQFCFVMTATLLAACDRGRERTNVLTAHGEPEVTLMDFSAPFPLDPLPAGWYHRTFWTRTPMRMSFAVKDGVPSLRFETQSSASMLFRHVDLDLSDYRFLTWRWYIEEPIESVLDEHTR